MSFDVCVKAPAKVNIGLNVLPARSDGFHGIESIFQTVDFCDELRIRCRAGMGCSVTCPQMVIPEVNTLESTYRAFVSETGLDFGIDVELEKFIPAGGGLGGGSSDGASLLKGLCELAGLPLTENLCDRVAGKVGSDVFFFLKGGYFQNGIGCALVSGRGEVVEMIEPRTDLSFLLVFPGIHSSTKEAYSLVDEAFKSGKKVICPDFSELRSLYYDAPKVWSFCNSFTPVLVDKYPVIGEAVLDILDCGADWAEMSGSGATVFGVFESELAAKRAALECQKKWRCVLAR